MGLFRTRNVKRASAVDEKSVIMLGVMRAIQIDLLTDKPFAALTACQCHPSRFDQQDASRVVENQ